MRRRSALCGPALLSGALLSLSLLACSPAPKQADAGAEVKASTNDLDAAPPKTTELAVRAITAQSGALDVQRSATATIQAQRDSNVAAQAGGAVRAVLAAEGEAVAAGQVVVQLDDTTPRQALENARLQLQQAQISLQQTQTNTDQATGALSAAVRSAEASLTQARQSAQSAENLYRLGGISQGELQAARSALAQAESQLAQARNALSQNGRSAQASVPLAQLQLQSAQAAVRQAQENLARTAVRAPFAGTVASVNVEVGEFAAQGSPVFRLVDPGSLRAKFSVPPADAAALKEGSALNLGYGGVNYVATVVGPGIAGSDRLVPITARVQGGEQLPVGGSAQVRYRARLGQGVLVPSAAVQVDDGESAVYVVQGGVARRTVVRVIAESGGRAALSGVSAGARVITPVPGSLQDGARVKVDGAAGTP